MIEGTEDDKVEKRVVERENRGEERKNRTESHRGGRERRKERNR